MVGLFDPLKVGALTLKNRVLMAPLTRSRATGADGRTPNALMAHYYEQRADAGLIITEATSVDAMGVGYEHTPGIWSDAHVEGWKLSTSAVHKKGGLIFLQLWHVGRISDPSLLNGQAPLAPSPIAAGGHVSLLRPERPYVVPREIPTSEVKSIVDQYKRGAELAKRAGFDGVEIHGANGYLIDQFLQDGSNKRTDQYGGSVENRARFMLEVTDAVISVWGADRVAMHLAPRRDSHSMGDSSPAKTFGYAAEQLGKRKLAFLCAREREAGDSLGPALKKAFGGVYVANEAFTKESAEKIIASGTADAVAFGKAYIANPDLATRFRENAPLNTPNPATFYVPGEAGYTDYPALK